MTLLSVNDVYLLEPSAEGRGGVARLATRVREIRRESPHTLFALAGDTLSPSLMSALFKGRQMVEAWNLLGLDVATFGNHEFDFGPGLLRARMGESRFLWLSSNVLDRRSRTPFGGARATWVKEFRGVRVGLVAVTVPETANTSSPGPDVEFLEPIAAAGTALASLGDVELRVALSHLEIARDEALALPLHAILGGHDHDPMVVPVGPTLILKAGADALTLGQVEYELGCPDRPFERRHRLHPIASSIPEAADVRDLVDRYAAALDRELDQPVGRAEVALDGREAEVRSRETNLGDFVTDVIRERLGADLALLNGGALRGNRFLPGGPITRRDVHALLPFGNVLALLEVGGAALTQALERAVSAYPRPAGLFLQVSGLRFVFDPARRPGQRVLEVTIGGLPLDPARAYTVALPDYLARGGDGYSMFRGARTLVPAEHGPGLVPALLAEVERRGSVRARTEGRIRLQSSGVSP
ncbi:MAG: 5'-nucleotidase C-terminal domain-containing protein [Candidatus Rokubacteria bacterium]|nr:5'-nucleotidase C-terminal domain-containing protein [Candidatus Rokubacteria bacterium]